MFKFDVQRCMCLQIQIRKDHGFIKYHLVEAKFLKMTHDKHVLRHGDDDGRSDSHIRSVDVAAQLLGSERVGYRLVAG